MILEAYPTLEPEMLPKLRVTRAPMTAACRGKNGDQPIECIPDAAGSHATVWKLESPSWHAETHDLLLNYDLTIALPIFLFGQFGLAASDGSVLGLAVQWVDAEASQRGSIPLAELSAADRRHPWHVHKQIGFPRGVLRGMLRLYLILYLKEPGIPAPQEKHLAQQPGTVFGILHEDRLVIDGNGSVFPVRQITDELAPLWRMSCNWDDISDPVSEETVCLELNQAHPDYAALYPDDGRQWSPLMREVLASALQVLITKAVSMADTPIRSGQDWQEGSVGQLVAYLQDVYDLSADRTTVAEDPETLATEIRLALRKQMHS